MNFRRHWRQELTSRTSFKGRLLPLTASAVLALALAGCASTGSLPKTAAEAAGQPGVVGKTGWARYQDTMFVRGIDRQTAFLAAKEGLSAASFVIKRGSEVEGSVVGSRGMTMYDWNVVAGVYFEEKPGGYQFSVVSQGSKDFGFWGDATARSWPQDIFRGIRTYIATESSITNPDKGIFEMRPADGAMPPVAAPKR